MRRLVSLCLLVLLSLTAIGCTKTTPLTPAMGEQDVKYAQYAKQLSDDLLAHYVGRDVTEASQALVRSVTQIGEGTTKVLLGEAASKVYEGVLSTAVSLPMYIPGSAYYSEPAPGDKPATLSSPELLALKEAIYVGDVVPDIVITDPDGAPTVEFARWFVTAAIKAGLLDSRLAVTEEGELYVLASDCTDAKGGMSFKVFDTTYNMSKKEIGYTLAEAKSSAVFDMELSTYKYFDTGSFTATYNTKQGNGASESVSVTVSFVRRGDLSAVNTYEAYLEAIEDIEVQLRGVN